MLLTKFFMLYRMNSFRGVVCIVVWLYLSKEFIHISSLVICKIDPVRNIIFDQVEKGLASLKKNLI